MIYVGCFYAQIVIVYYAKTVFRAALFARVFQGKKMRIMRFASSSNISAIGVLPLFFGFPIMLLYDPMVLFLTHILCFVPTVDSVVCEP